MQRGDVGGTTHLHSEDRWEEDEFTVMHRKLDSGEPDMVRLCVWPVWVSALTLSDLEQHDERAQDPITQLINTADPWELLTDETGTTVIVLVC